MSVPFIDITEADQISELRQYFESQDIKIAAIENDNVYDNVKAIIEATPEIWKQNDVKDIEGIMNSVLSLMFVIPANKGEELVKLLCEKLRLGIDSGKHAVSLKALHNLFHGYHRKTPFLFDIYCTWVEVGGKCRSIHLIPTDFKQIDSWLSWWKVNDDDRHKLFRILYDAFVQCGQSDDAQKVMMKLLESYTEENASQAREDAVKCVTRSLADPNMYLFDELMTLKPVQVLKGELLYELLTIFVNGNVKDYQTFYDQNKEFVESVGLDHEKNLHKIKLLTLVDTVDKSHDITFDDVIERLGITEDDVEEFIIDAMQRKLIRGRIDQINRKVIVSQASLRTFSTAQWQQLSDRLQHWKNNLVKVNERLQTVPPETAA